MVLKLINKKYCYIIQDFESNENAEGVLLST